MRATPKTVLIVSHYYPPHLGGIEIVAQNQAERLAALGHTVTVVSSSVSTEQCSGMHNGVRVIRIKAWNILEDKGVPFPLFYPTIITTLFREVKRSDIVHIHDAFYISSWCAAVWAKFHKRPIVLTQHVSLIAHGSRLVNLIQRSVYATTGAAVFHASARILTLNDRVEGFLVAKGISRRKLDRLANGVDCDLFYPASKDEKQRVLAKYGLTTDKKIVLFVGRFVSKKGFDKVIAAQSSRYQLVFVGGSTQARDTSHIKFLGTVSQHTLAEIYRAANIFILPSEGEGFPLSVQEAMASGLPVIMSDDAGYAQYKLDKNLTYLLSSRQPATIKRVIEELIDNPEQCQRMATYSLRYARKHFSWPQRIAELDSIYDSVLRIDTASA